MRQPASILSIAAILAFGLGSTVDASAQARQFEVPDGGGRIQFVSDAPLETITGRSSTMTGRVSVEPEDMSSWSGTLYVPVASIRTGDDLRDRHLRADNWLDAGRYPNATFEITRVEGASRLEPNQVTNLRVRGRFTIHGVARDITARARVRLDGDQLHIRASFTVHLPDHNVSVPALVRLKVSDDIRVNVSVDMRAS